MNPRDFFTPEHDMFRDEVMKFLQMEAVPFHESWEKQGHVGREIWLKAGAAGLLCTGVSEEFGGVGCDWRYSTIIIEALARLNLTGLGFSLHSDIVAPYIEHYGNTHLKQKYLPKMISGEFITAIAMSEPEAGSDLQNLKSTAELRGDSYILNGSKTFITNGGLADVAIIAAKTNPAAGAKGISLFVVETSWPGFEKGKNLDKIGMKAQDTAEFFFKNVQVPKENLLGVENKGFGYLMQELPQERLLVAIQAVANAEAALDWTIAYTKERKTFGQPLIEFQNTRFKLAEMKADVVAGRSFVDACIKDHLAKKFDVPSAAMAKFWCTDLQCRVLDQCLQLFGGYGYMREYPIARAWADSRVQKIYAGTNEIMKEVVARSL